MTRLRAVIFDVDGTLAETEEAHRRAFNETFPSFGLDWFWDRDLYGELLQVAGGKERMRYFAGTLGVASDALPDARLAQIHAAKTVRYTALVATGQCPLRTGVRAAMEAARQRRLRLAIATTTTRSNVDALLSANFGPEADGLFETIVAGDDVPRKKPAPDVYLEALSRLRLRGEECLAIEDTSVGLSAALAAAVTTWITPSLYSRRDCFPGAAIVLADLSDFDRLIEALCR
jgi:HAD superfamily hydrolase (TIGR01509 family)